MTNRKPTALETGAALIAAERSRQVSEENWSASHDDEHTESGARLILRGGGVVAVVDNDKTRRLAEAAGLR